MTAWPMLSVPCPPLTAVASTVVYALVISAHARALTLEQIASAVKILLVVRVSLCGTTRLVLLLVVLPILPLLCAPK